MLKQKIRNHRHSLNAHLPFPRRHFVSVIHRPLSSDVRILYVAHQDTPIHAARDLARGIGRSDRQHHPGMAVPQAVRYAGKKMVEKLTNNETPPIYIIRWNIIVLTFLRSCLLPSTFSVHAQSSPRSESLQARGRSWYAP